MVGKIGRLIGGKLGACHRCMQLSLLVAGLSWVAAMLVTGNVFVIIVAVLFTALTLAHYVAFGIRKLVLAGAEDGAPTGGCAECSSRRSFLGLVARAVSLAFLAQYVSAAPAAAQQNPCQFDNQTGKCTGECPKVTVFEEDGTKVEVTPKCGKADGCYCRQFSRDSPNCRKKSGDCRGQCPRLYRSKEDARAQRNPIKGKCVAQGGCTCVYPTPPT